MWLFCGLDMIDFGVFELNKSKYNLHFIIILSSYYHFTILSCEIYDWTHGIFDILSLVLSAC